MKDFLGRDLVIGDNVVAMQLLYRDLIRCQIIGFTPKKVRLVPFENINDFDKVTNLDTFLQLPCQIVLIKEEK